MNEKERKAKNNKLPSNDYVVYRHDKKTKVTEVEFKIAPRVLEEVYKIES